jgi:deoxyribonuclease V
MEPSSWPKRPADAVSLQLSLRQYVKVDGPVADPVRTLAGLDVTYDRFTSRIVAAAVVMDGENWTVVEECTVTGAVDFPYIPGLFAFRELPALTEVLRKVTVVPDVLICDGHGMAHVRRFGLACHLGLLTGIPTIGVAKNNFVGDYETPAMERGSQTPIVADGDVVGCALRTRGGVKPVFVSVGHLIDLATAARIVLQATPRFRVPEPVRRADHISRIASR